MENSEGMRLMEYGHCLLPFSCFKIFDISSHLCALGVGKKGQGYRTKVLWKDWHLVSLQAWISGQVGDPDVLWRWIEIILSKTRAMLDSILDFQAWLLVKYCSYLGWQISGLLKKSKSKKKAASILGSPAKAVTAEAVRSSEQLVSGAPLWHQRLLHSVWR